MAGEIFDAPNKQAVGLDPPWVEGTGGSSVAEPKAKAEAKESKQDEEKRLPGQHAGLDKLAAERGYEWSQDDLTVAEKQAELEEAS
jgi:hypothetical protein